MNKITTAALAGLVAVTATANASVSRHVGFGDIGTAFIADVQDKWSLPGVVASQPNALYMEFGANANPGAAGTGVNQLPTNAWGGVTQEVGPGKLAIWVGRGQNSTINNLYSALNTNFTTLGTLAGSTVNTAIGSTPATLDANALNTLAPAAGRVDVLYGFSLSETLDLGILISRGNRNGKVENVGGVAGRVDAYDANALGFGVGVEVKEAAIFSLLEIGATMDTDSILVSSKSTAGEDKVEHNANVFAVRIGGDMAGEEGAFSRVELGFAMGSAASKNGVTSATVATGDKEFKTGGTMWNLGYAAGKSGEKGMGLLGAMLKGNSGSSETDGANSKSDNSSLALLVGAAGEAKVREWATARAGVTQNVYQTSSATAAGASNQQVTNRSNNGATTLSTGLSLMFGDWTLDGVLNQDVLYTGTFLVSGVAEALFGQVSATLVW
jgi:hypothetical protein